jgi:hypothetical protein
MVRNMPLVINQRDEKYNRDIESILWDEVGQKVNVIGKY